MAPPLPTVRLPSDSKPQRHLIYPTPLTSASFSPFGTAILPPLASTLTTPPPTISSLPSTAFPASTGHALDPVLANQGTAVKFSGISPGYGSAYAEAPSATSSPPSTSPPSSSGLWTPSRRNSSSTTTTAESKGTPAMTMFSCFSRPAHHFRKRKIPSSTTTTLPLTILERHPYTTQTFIPLSTTSPSSARFLIIVAPTLSQPPLNPPDLRNVRAFVARPGMAVTYARGTWHAPMIVLPSEDEDGKGKGKSGRVDFVVVQWVSGVAEEDCQEVLVEWGDGEGDEGRGVEVVVDGLDLEKGGGAGRGVGRAKL